MSDERPHLPLYMRCTVKHRQYRCSLAAGHDGQHEAYFDDQREAPSVDEVVTAYRLLRLREQHKPVPRKHLIAHESRNSRSHHLSEPGEWIPRGHATVEIPDERDPWMVFWDDEACPPDLALEDRLPWERRRAVES